MSHRKDTDYLSISARIRVMENRLLTRERMDRMIEARDTAEAMKVLVECGYPDRGGDLNAVLAQARADTFREMEKASPDCRLSEIFQLKYDYHNAKVLLKAAAVGEQAERLMLPGGRYDRRQLLESWNQEDLGAYSEEFQQAMAQAQSVLADSGDPQKADLILDRACYREMALLANELHSDYLRGYVRLAVDIANLRTAVRVHRMGRERDFLRQALLEGGNVPVQTILSAQGDGLGKVFWSGPLAQAAELGAQLTQPDSGPLTAFEKACDDALTAYLASAHRVPFGEQVVIGYLYAKEAELTAIRTIFAGRAAGLDGDTIRARLRETYA